MREKSNNTPERAVRQKKHTRFDCVPGCSVEAAVNILEGKWKAIILWHLLEEEVLRFNQVKKYVPNATSKMLSKQLQELEADQLVSRRILDISPPGVEYQLTELGLTLAPILLSLKKWGDKHINLYGKIGE